MSHCIVDQGFESMLRLGFPKDYSFCCLSAAMYHLFKHSQALFSLGDLTSVCFSHIGTKEHATEDCFSMDLSDDITVGREEIVCTPQRSIHLATFNVSMFNQIGQQAALARTLEWCVSEIRIWGLTSVITLHGLNTTSFRSPLP